MDHHEFIFQQEPCSVREKITIDMCLSRTAPRLRLADISTSHPLVVRTSTPVGSVEFVSAYANALGVTLPDDVSYPQALADHLGRAVRAGTFEEARAGDFVKPRGSIKAFTGGIKSDVAEQPADCPVWISEPLQFLQEWRVYVYHGRMVGLARYDESDSELPLPGTSVEQMIDSFVQQPVAFSLDVGLVQEGQLLLVEVNDAWALGYYSHGTCRPRTYRDMLMARWQELCRGGGSVQVLSAEQ